MGIISIVLVILIVICVSSSNNKKRVKERQRKQERLLQQQIDSILEISQQMRSVPRIRQLVNEVVSCANTHQHELKAIRCGGTAKDEIFVELQDTQKDQWAPVQRGQTIKIRCTKYDFKLKSNDEIEAFLYLVLNNCPFLTYRTWKMGETQDFKAAHYDSDSDGDYAWSSFVLYRKTF